MYEYIRCETVSLPVMPITACRTGCDGCWLGKEPSFSFMTQCAVLSQLGLMETPHDVDCEFVVRVGSDGRFVPRRRNGTPGDLFELADPPRNAKRATRGILN